MDRRSERGFSLLEAVIFGSITAALGLIFSSMVKQPGVITTRLVTTNVQQPGYHAMDVFTSDLRESDPTTFPWSSISMTGVAISSVTFNKQTYDMATGNPIIPAVSDTYIFQPDANDSQGCLYKTEGNAVMGSTTTLLLSNLDPPTAAYPLIEQDNPPGDVNANMVMVTLLYHPSGSQQLRLVQRIAMR